MKKQDIKSLSVEELHSTVEVLKKELSKLKIVHAVSPLEKPLEIREKRKTIARVQTEIRARELQIN